MTTLGEIRRVEQEQRARSAASPARRSGSFVTRLAKAYRGTVENAEVRLGRLEAVVIGDMVSTNIRYHDNLIIALQQRVDLLTRALAKAGIVGEELFEDRPLADSCPWSCDPGSGCPSCERQPEQYCWRCDAALEAAS